MFIDGGIQLDKNGQRVYVTNYQMRIEVSPWVLSQGRDPDYERSLHIGGQVIAALLIEAARLTDEMEILTQQYAAKPGEMRYYHNPRELL